MVNEQAPRAVDRDMAEQPDVLAGLLERRAAIARDCAPLLRRPPAGVLLVARGSSDNAATYGRYILEAALGRPAALSANSLFTRYDCRTALSGWLVVAVSQSGETPEITEVLTRAAELGGTSLALTNSEDSSLARAAQIVVPLGAGTERAVPATKTYTATLLALALLAEICGTPPWATGALSDLPAACARVLADTAGLADAVATLRAGTHSVHLGTGYLYCAALESALKMRETALLPVEGYAHGDFLHGPIAASGAGTIAVSHVGSGPTRPDAVRSAENLRARGATVLALGAHLDDFPCDRTLSLDEAPEALAALPHAIVGQQLAIGVATALGLDPDHPQGLRKVTIT